MVCCEHWDAEPKDFTDYARVISMNDIGLPTAHQQRPTLAKPFQQARLDHQLQMARDARLALAQHLRQLTHRQFHQPQQGDDAQPSRVRQGLESISERKRDSHWITI